MNQLFRPLPCLFVLAVVAGTSSDALASVGKQAQHEKKTDTASVPRLARKASLKPEALKQETKKQETKKQGTKKDAPKKDAKSKAALKKEAKKDKHAERIAAKQHKSAPSDEKPAESATPALTGDLAVLKSVFDLARQAKTSDATAAEKTIGDPAAQKLAEWFILRHPDSQADFGRYASFVANNPDWPGVGVMRRRAEARLWQEKSNPGTVLRFTGNRPITAKGRLALARVLLGEGDRDGAQRLVREAWRSEDLSERTETDVMDAFPDLLTREDNQARMDKRIGAKDFSAAMRVAHRLGDDALATVKACAAVKGNDDKASDLLDAIATDARQDLGYVLCRAQWMMHQNKFAEASRLILAAPAATMALQDTDEWWRVRRVLARKLLDQGDFQSAYQIASQAAAPASDNYRSESHFLPGWIALRYLDDPKTAATHFALIDEGCVNPITLARANYWRARAAEALGDNDATQADYEAAAHYPTAYYGQLARARLGLAGIELRAAPPDKADGSPSREEIVRAADMLYTLGERDTVVSFVDDLAEDSTDVATLAAVAELTGRHSDARAMLELGKTALGRGLALDAYAFPTIGIPTHNPIGPAVDRSVIYSVARTESAFNQRDRSSADAVGLMQVTPEAGRDTAKRFGVEYDWDRMVSDPVYNTQMGAAELSALLQEYKGSPIMTFAGYNAGRGRVRDWVKQYGDPRDPNVDAVDWVERIPFAETRNYVQRVMENLLVYRARFEQSQPLIAKFDQHAPAAQEANSAPPTQ